MTKLVIISGVTGAIGNALLAEYGRQKDMVIYGVSRQALNLNNFIDPISGKLYPKSLICSLSGLDEAGYRELASSIDFNCFSEVIYIHALGVYPFEVNERGEHVVNNDNDGDGIDDRCLHLSYDAFRFAASEIIAKTASPVKCVIFGGLSDKHGPLVHKSWNCVICKVKEYMKTNASHRVTMLILDISSVVCSHEMITRPFVFINTDADHSYWLTPWEVSGKVARELKKKNSGYRELELFNSSPKFEIDHYQDSKFTPRKMSELFRAKS